MKTDGKIARCPPAHITEAQHPHQSRVLRDLAGIFQEHSLASYFPTDSVPVSWGCRDKARQPGGLDNRHLLPHSLEAGRLRPRCQQAGSC